MQLQQCVSQQDASKIFLFSQIVDLLNYFSSAKQNHLCTKISRSKHIKPSTTPNFKIRERGAQVTKNISNFQHAIIFLCVDSLLVDKQIIQNPNMSMLNETSISERVVSVTENQG